MKKSEDLIFVIYNDVVYIYTYKYKVSMYDFILSICFS